MEIDEAFSKLSDQSQRLRDELVGADNRQWDKLEKISDEVGDIKTTVAALPCVANGKRLNGIEAHVEDNTSWRLKLTGGILLLAFLVSLLGIDRLI